MSALLLNLAGAVALLLWSVRMIRTGVERAYSGEIRAGLRRLSATHASAAAGGTVSAFALQSATAVAILAAGFVTSGSLVPASGLAVLLGADIGSALVARVLVHPIDAAIPVLLLVGVGLFLKGWTRRLRQTGRIVIGLALVLTSLSMIRASTAMLGESETLSLIAGLLADDAISAFLLGALVAWAMHSSLAAVLMTAAFASDGLLSMDAALPIILGANLGGAVIPVVLLFGASPAARRIALGNCLLRGGGAVVALWVLGGIAPAQLGLLGSQPAVQTVNLHLAFNLMAAVLALPLVRPVLGLIEAVEPRPATEDAGTRISALDPAAVADPDRALACASREVLRIGESVHAMLLPSVSLMRHWDDDIARSIARLEGDVDRMHFEIKLYVARLQEGPLTEEQARRALSIASIATGLEEAGDTISAKIAGMARRMATEGLGFSTEGARDIEDFHDRVCANAQLALNVLVTADPGAARQVVEEKERVRRMEQSLQKSHLDRLRHGNPASIETSNLHQETLRALKQVNTAFSMAAYPIAEEAGDLLSSRLAEPAAIIALRQGDE
ncbi:Na/Pi cotransporter family protein [Paralimibaculum aggregatum]|uniref:Na/Pi cotransporter family protein n=1 Tax=Paralimibaculum aggregatum TaxID=3036245 RepID=A0ABQ6LTJ4_9RHOB|nr:Na/Pi cotransporter family protein [Limibaculum sp. NKW23]GMG85381.1 Na/Pi cotransporter family protein [Limibaculum sp. NKW23]